MALGLVDELRLMIDPLVAGGGKRLFRDDGALRPLRLADSQVTSTGAIIATYAAAGERDYLTRQAARLRPTPA
jgi:riboflavin biosynthesis pyrimidine reductase